MAIEFTNIEIHEVAKDIDFDLLLLDNYDIIRLFRHHTSLELPYPWDVMVLWL